MRILLATDGSPCSEAAVEEVARRWWPEGSEVRVVSAADPSLMYRGVEWTAHPANFEAFRSELTRVAEAAIASAVARIAGRGRDDVEVTSEVLEGPPKREILRAADAWEADLIVVGSHGYGTVGRFLLGSVSAAVATHATCSVEIVRSRRPPGVEED